jgi:hypothetical protein
MKKLKLEWGLAIVTIALAVTCALSGCAHKLELGGAYRPATTNAAGILVDSTSPDYGFFVVDLAFSTAYSAIDAALTFERNNREMLWKVSPDIKHNLDAIRPVAWDITVRYAKARKQYLANPLPAGLTTLQNVLGEIQKIAGVAARAVPTKGNQ